MTGRLLFAASLACSPSLQQAPGRLSSFDRGHGVLRRRASRWRI
jgi:hypothetical protein